MSVTLTIAPVPRVTARAFDGARGRCGSVAQDVQEELDFGFGVVVVN